MGRMSEWTENRPTRGWRALDVGEVWRYRHLIATFARRDVTVRYRQAFLGAAWAALLPLSGAIIFTVAFSRLAGIDTGDTPYLLFAFTGWVGWTYFSSALLACSGALVRNATLVTKVWFPRLAAPLAALLPGLADLAVGLLVLVPLCVYYGVTPGPAIVFAPAAIGLLATTALGVGLVLGTLHVRYRDVGHAIGLLVQLWLFASPVAYPSSLVSDGLLWVYYLNPVAGALDLLRAGLLDAPGPGAPIVASLAVAVVLLALGAAVFARGERRFADVI
jgi:ABC-type polysaccharide/polyol phosphate export permease